MKQTYDLARLDWRLTGWAPHLWRLQRSMETGLRVNAEVAPIPATVPGSVQGALREAGIVPDWNAGLNARECEWVENRHWIYEARLPDHWFAHGLPDHESAQGLPDHESARGHGLSYRLSCLGLDYAGWIFVNGREVSAFKGSLRPHVFDLSLYLRETGNILHIIFDCPPRWLGQFGFTSQMREWKPRFNYTWDWTPRLVQIGVWDALTLEASDGQELQQLRCTATADLATGTGILQLQGTVAGDAGTRVRVDLQRGATRLHTDEFTVARFASGVSLTGLPVELWWPNGQGEQPLYTLQCHLLDSQDREVDLAERRVGFKHLGWASCEGAPEGADPWLCAVNGRPTFLQGVNWSPIRPNFADVTPEQYRQRLKLYRDLGCNILRVWGGAYLEKSYFYDVCDELGLLVWQEFPLSSSGIDNWPPEDEDSIARMAEIAASYIARRQHHVSVALWCGGNELQGALDGGKVGTGKPVDLTHPLIDRLRQVVTEQDPERRFLPTSSSGPRFYAREEDFGQGLHWDVHGPWSAEADLDGKWTRYWQRDDALFRSETGAPGASPVAIIRAYKGGFAEAPGTIENPLWARNAWWIEWPEFVREHGREPRDLEEYVAWSQERQQRALSIAARACKSRFPRCGGFIIWMGHDCFPCAANTAIVDFDGNPKPAAEAIGAIFRGEQ